MSKKGSSAPAYPDVNQTAAAQTAANKDTAITQARLNRTNTYGPGYSITWDKNSSGVPMSQRVTLDPTQQATFENQQGTYNALSELARNMSGHLPTNAFNVNQAGLGADKVGDALYGQYMARLNPQFEQQNQSFERQMQMKGIPIGSAAYNAEKDRMDRARNEALLNATNAATTATGAEQNRLVNLALLERQQPMNELSALLNGSSVFQAPQLSSAQVGVNGTDVSGLINNAYNSRLASWQNSENQAQNFQNTLAQLAGSAMLFL